MNRKPNTIYVAMISYGKDSLAMLEAIKQLGYPLDRIVHTEVWATDTIPADLPPMTKFKGAADKIIKNLYGIEVERNCAMKKVYSHSVNAEREPLSEWHKLTYEDMFYHRLETGKFIGTIKGFPLQRGAWCNKLKTEKVDLQGYILSNIQKWSFKRKNLRFSYAERKLVYKRVKNSCTGFYFKHLKRGADINIVKYLGIASDEPKRINRHKDKTDVVLPLVDIGWNEEYCRQWCKENDLLSPIYTSATRGGCWFCHNQGVEQLRLLRKNYPEHWELLLKWDSDSPVTFHSDGHTVHDFDKRFSLEEVGAVPKDKKFRWWMIEQNQLSLFY